MDIGDNGSSDSLGTARENPGVTIVEADRVATAVLVMQHEEITVKYDSVI